MKKFQQSFDLLKLLRVRYKVVSKVMPLSEKLWDSLALPFKLNMMLAMGRTTKLAERVKLTRIFFEFVLSYKANHGAEATVKWLKAALVALQKELGQDRLVSLRSLGTIGAYSRLTNGLPRLIPASKRRLIRSGNVREIRFWTGLFNLYRVLECPSTLKMQTITGPFTGSVEFLNWCINQVTEPKSLFFDTLKGFKDIRSMSLVPTDFVLSRAASPSNRQSLYGILTDAFNMRTHQPILWKAIMDYLFEVDRSSEGIPFGFTLDRLADFASKAVSLDDKVFIPGTSGTDYAIRGFAGVLPVKASLSEGYLPGEGQGLSQFAVKKEAAGKIRLFALLDSISQSVLAPLHDMLFALLRIIPNDGTFDQEASIKRSQQKALEANCAFSFDLTAATDRLPAKLTAQIIAGITGMNIAVLWWRIMTGRSFWFSDNVADDLKVSKGPYHYAVGQPMGGLSSWAGLAVTHHWVVQLAAFRVTNSYSWNTSYEILGDDLVIFDPLIADEYLKIMADLGCEINLFKSIVSKQRPVFEFAKRTCWGLNIVSGISINQVQAGWNVGGRVNNALAWIHSGLITSLPLLAMTLSRNTVNNRLSISDAVFRRKHTYGTYKNLALSILGLLGNLHTIGRLSLVDFMQAIIDPNKGYSDFSSQTVGLPLKASLKAIYDSFGDVQRPFNQLRFTKYEQRVDIFEENKTALVTTMLYLVRNQARDLLENYQAYMKIHADGILRYPYLLDGKTPAPFEDLPQAWQALYQERDDIVNQLFGLHLTDNHPEFAMHLIESYISRTCVDFEGILQLEWWPDDRLYNEVVEISEWINAMAFKLKPFEVEPPKTTVLESAPILKLLRKADVTGLHFGRNYKPKK